MTTRLSNPDALIPISDPEEILWAARRRARIAAALNPPNPTPIPTTGTSSPPIPLNSTRPDQTFHTPPQFSSPPSPFIQNRTMSSSNHQETTPRDEMSMEQCIRAMLDIQQNTAHQLLASQTQIVAAQKLATEQRASNAEKIKILEQLLQNAAVKAKPTLTPGLLANGHIDLARFRTSDSPHFAGPFQIVEPFLKWMQGVSIFYSTRGVTHDDDKQLILGSLITETNLLTFYSNESPRYAGKTWAEFKNRLFGFCLPSNWRSDLRTAIRRLEMSSAESFLKYSGRARTLQSLVNFKTKCKGPMDPHWRKALGGTIRDEAGAFGELLVPNKLDCARGETSRERSESLSYNFG